MNKIFKILIILLVQLGFSSSFAQKQELSKLDSLFLLFQNTTKISSKVDILNEISYVYWDMNNPEQKDSMKYYTNLAIQLSRKANYTKGLGLALLNLGKYNISMTHNYSEATPYLLESIELFEKLKDSAGISKCYLQLGLISYILQYYEDAIKNFRVSLSYFESITPEYLMALSYTEIGDIPNAKKYFSLAIEDYKKNNNQNMLNSCFMYLGKLYVKDFEPDSAFYYLNLAIERIKNEGNNNLLIRPYAFISSVYLMTKNVNRAIYYAEKSYQMSLKSYDMISQIESATTLSKAYKFIRNYKKAYFFLDLLNNTKESFFKGSTKQKVAEMQSTFDFKKKRQNDSLLNEKERLRSKLEFQETLHKKNNERNILISCVVGIFVIMVSIVNRLRYINKTAKIIKKEKARSEDLLLNILPFEVAEELKTKGSAEAKQFDNVTVMLTDFVNFTHAVENMTPQSLIDELHTCFKNFDEIIRKYKIEKIKTSGDSYLAICGLPAPDPKHAENMANAAIEINRFICERFEQIGDSTFKIRIGINSGSVIAGIVGVDKFAYDIWGDTVNIAARMEQNSIPGRINISGSTYELIKDKFECTYRGKIEAKNKGEIDMYFINESV